MEPCRKKTFVAVAKVREFIAAQPDECQAEYVAIVDKLEKDGFLVEPYAKKLDADLFEIRLRRGRLSRVLYFYYEGDLVIGVHAFVKKSQKTPQQALKQARSIMSQIRQGDYHE